VAAAFSQILNKDIIVPPHNGVVGAIGVALLAREKMAATHSPSRFRGWDLEKVDYQVREFTCKGCSNECDIRQFTIGGEKTYWGDKCSDRYRKRAKVDKKPVIRDLVEFRKALMCSYVTEAEDTTALLRSGTAAPLGTMGLPRAMYTYERLPFWATFFRACGFDLLLSRQTDKKIRELGLEGAVAEPCFPIRVAHGHVAELIEEGADHIFLPNFLNEETDHPEMESHACPWGQTLPYVIRFAPQFEAEAPRLYAPILHFRRGPQFVGEALRTSLKPLGVPARVVDEALKEAYEAQNEFRGRLVTAGAEALALLEENDELGVVLVGRPYNIYDSGINMDIPAKLRRYYGVNVIPMDFLPLWGTDTRGITPNMFWNYGRKILQAAKIVSGYPNLHLVYMTNFKCGPDSYVKHYMGAAAPEPFLVLQFDEHTNDAGAMTRCEAYLDSKGFLRWWAREDRAKQPVRGR
jgi:predicted nucleotide-binding protein (sugar kinase/HSP70/actin superfamily)